jgi:hypothetical protein
MKLFFEKSPKYRLSGSISVNQERTRKYYRPMRELSRSSYHQLQGLNRDHAVLGMGSFGESIHNYRSMQELSRSSYYKLQGINKR